MIDKNNLMSICKEHCGEIYDTYFSIHNNLELALQLTCQDLDVCFNQQALKETKSQIENLVSKGKKAEAVFGYYKSKLMSTSKNNAGLDSFRYKDSDFPSNEIKKNVQTNDNSEDFDTIEIEYLKVKWGSSLPSNDLVWLEQKYNEWYDNYDIQGKSMDLLIQQLCFEEFFVYQERQEGKDVSKRLKSIQDMMKSSKLSPRQETASEQAEFQTISEFIKKVEQTKPFIKTSPEFEDVDKINNMWRSIAGAITRTSGNSDENTKVFDEFFKNDTLDLSNLSNKEGI